MADDFKKKLFTAMAESKVRDMERNFFAERDYRREYVGEFDYDPYDPYGNRKREWSPGEKIRMASEIIKNVYDESMSNNSNPRLAEACKLALGGISDFHYREQNQKSQLADSRSETIKLRREIQELVDQAKTMVQIEDAATRMEELTTWCNENFPDRWQLVFRNVFVFEDKKSAALFKLMFG
jgi:hypothetical protein